MIDSHVHLNHENFVNQIDEYLDISSKNDVDFFLCVGWDLKSSFKAVEIANKYKNVFVCVGVHPENIKEMNIDDFSKIEKLLINNKKIIAIGEIGLDFHFEKDEKNKKNQIEYFIKFIKLANKYNLPVVIHSRNANTETYEILKKYPISKKAVFHCYSAGKGFVEKYLKMNFYFGIGGVLTFKNAINIKEAVKDIPINNILLETDAPFLTPEPFRGQINHSKYLSYIAKEIANIKNISIDSVKKNTDKNFFDLFNLNYACK